MHIALGKSLGTGRGLAGHCRVSGIWQALIEGTYSMKNFMMRSSLAPARSSSYEHHWMFNAQQKGLPLHGLKVHEGARGISNVCH